MTTEHAELVQWCETYPKDAADEIAHLRSAIDIARTALLQVERRSEETRALISQYIGDR